MKSILKTILYLVFFISAVFFGAIWELIKKA